MALALKVIQNHDSADTRNDPHRLDTRSWDRSTFRLWLLQTWGYALTEGRLREKVALGPQEWRDIRTWSALQSWSRP